MSKIQIGEKSPIFSLPNQEGNIINLQDFAGKKLILYFYPKDDTSGCTLEAQQFTLLSKEFAQQNTKIIGVSKDSCLSHKKFINKYSLEVELISDENNNICELFDVWKEKSMYGKKYMGIERTTFLIDENGFISNIWNKVKPDGHANEVLEFIKSKNL